MPLEESSADGFEQPKPDDLLGTVFVGRYELSSVLGTGGMGVIYKGRQIFLDRPVAVKVLKGAEISPKARMRFHQEAKASSSLNHPGIVSIIDFGVDEADRPYMAMEFVEGCSLAELLAERLVLSLEDCLPIFLETCDALGAAHKKGIVHRDVKPSNIMLVVEDDAVRVKLLDFGIAKVLDFPGHTLQDLTKTGDTLGTPLYMSPEQINSKSVTYASDLYSLGCTMYACLTGAPPFIGETKMETMEMHCNDEPMSLEEASDGLQFPADIEAIIMRLLEKKVDDRFGSAEQVREALVAMISTLAAKETNLVSPDGATFSNWTGSVSGMSKSVSDSVHNSLAGRTRLAPSRSFNDSYETVVDPTKSPENKDDESLFWVSDLSERVNRAGGNRGINALRSSPLVESASSRERRNIFPRKRSKVFLILVAAFILGIVAYSSPSGFRYFMSSSSAVKRPNSNMTIALPVGKEFVIPNANSSQAANRPDSDVSSADTVIERTIRLTPSVESLSLQGMYGLSDIGLSKLDQLKKLDALNLSETGLTGSGVKIVSALNLKLLTVAGNEQVSDWSLFYLSSMPSLQGLSLRETGISNAGLKYLARVRTLKRLILDHNREISNQGVANLNPSISSIESLSLARCNMDDEVVPELLKFRNLRELSLSGNPAITNGAIALLLKNSNNLETLSLADCDIDESGVAKLHLFTRLRVLDLSGISLKNDNLVMLSQMNGLKQLYVANCGLSRQQVNLLTKKLPNTKVTESRFQLCL